MRACGGPKPSKQNICTVSIFHLTVKRGSRSENRLSVAKHDYIMRLGRFSERHDGELAFADSGNMPGWAKDDPRKFWGKSDERERANGTLYHEIEFALPRELTLDQQIDAARNLARQICGTEHPFSWGLHNKDGNPHVHLILSGRMLDGIERDADQFFKRYNNKNPERGGCRKESSGDARGPEWVKQVRKEWQEIANRSLAVAGQESRIDHRSHKERGLDEAPGVHLGRRATRLEQRGKFTRRGLKNREAQHLNASLRTVRSKIKEKEHGHLGRNGNTHHHQRRAGATPQRAFTAWRDGGARGAEDHQGLRASRRSGPERMPTLCQPGAGGGFQAQSNLVLQGAVPGSGSRNHGLHALHAGAGGLYVHDTLTRRQFYKRQLLENAYQAHITTELAERLAFVARAEDHLTITLKGGGRVIDRGDRLTTTRAGRDQEIDAGIALAVAKGWKQIHLTGSESFKSRAYLEATRAGLVVLGYQPPAEILAQLQKEKPMLEQAGAGAMALTPDTAAASSASPASRWLEPLRSAREKLEAERKAAKTRLDTLRETDLTTLEKALASEHGGAEYQAAMLQFRTAAAAAKEAGVLGRKRAEVMKEAAWQRFLALHNQLLAVPAVAQPLAEAAQQNKTREQLITSFEAAGLGIGQIQAIERDITRGGDHEAEFRKAWQYRKQHRLQPWQELVLAPVFEADAAREQARLKAEADSVAQAKQTQHQEQIQREIDAQKQADAIDEQLGRPGLSAKAEEVLEQQRRYYLAVADGHDENEARELAKAPNLH